MKYKARLIGKRYIKKLVQDGIVDGWDDPRLVSIAALRRRGFTPESIRKFVELCGVSKANSSTDYAMLEYCIREDLKLKKPRMMAALDPVKLIIDNYPEGEVEYLDVPNNLENESLGSRQVPFCRELYIDRDDFMEEPPKKYFRLKPEGEVRLKGAYVVRCSHWDTDENGNVTNKPLYFFLERYMQSFTDEMTEFINAVQNDVPTKTTVNDGLEALRLGLAAKLSVAEHRPVKLSEIEC